MASSGSGTSNPASDIINESQLESATVALALDLSEVSYDTYGSNGVMYTKNASGALVVDPKVYDLTDPSNGWTQITGLNTEVNAADHYQGVAFYKVVNGITEIVIANRGSQPGGSLLGLQDYIASDGGLTVGLTPQADQDALAYYNAVAAWAQTQNFANPVNILETGHSLGGQEADYVEVSVSSNQAAEYNTQAVTFNAPGLGHFVAQSGVNYDALNIVLENDLVHVGGALINGGYAGVQTTLPGGVPIQPYENDIMEGLLGNPVKLIAGLKGLAVNGLYVNHITDPLDAYLQEHPALGGVDLLQYYPTQITQAAIDVMESETSPTDYLQMSPSELAQYYTNLLGTPAGPGSGTGSAPPAGAQNPISNSSGETFTESTTDNSVVLTGSDGDVYTLTTDTGTLTVTDTAGDTDTVNLNSVGAATSDSWSNATGVTGQDTYNSDGSSSGKLTYANGGYATYFDDGQGDITTDYYTTSGILFSWSASHSDGSAITGTEFGNGLTTLPGSTAADLSIPTSLYQTTLDPDGSYGVASWNPANQSMLTEYDSSGNVTSSSTAQGQGQNYSQSDLTETTSTDSSGRTTTLARDATGDLVWQSWTNTDGSSGKITYNASDVVIEKDVNADGSSELTSSYASNVTHNFFDTNGLLASDTWTMADGASGSDTFNPDGSARGTIEKTDGSESFVTIDTALDILIDNESASGDMLSQDWWQNNGTHGVTTYTSGGSYTIYSYQTNGQLQVTDYSAGGAVEGQDTMAAGAAFSPDGSEFGEVTNPDGSYSINYTDSDGESLIFNVASGTVQSVDHLSSQVASEFSIPTQSGPDAQSPYNYSTPVTVSADGTQTIDYLNGSDSVTGDSWTKPDGTHGVDTFEADGSSFGTVFATDGSYYTYTNSGAGDATTEYYDVNGDLTSDAWKYTDGSYGSDQYTVGGSSSGYAHAADGSYTDYVNDGQGDITDDSFSTTGALVGDSWEKSDGSYGSDVISADGSKTGVAYQADGSYLTYAADSSGDDLTKYYSASNQLDEQVWELQGAGGANVTFTFDGSGNLLSQAVNTSSGTSYSLTGSVNAALGSLVKDTGNADTLTGATSGGVILAWGNQDSITSGGGSTLVDAGGVDDVVTGGSGNDTLDALGAGTTLIGGLGNETFEINDATDVVQAQTDAASNTLYSTVNYTLPTNVDTLTLQGSGNLTAYGNSDAANLITGNDGDDTLIAGTGNDTLVTGTGIDFLVGGSGADAFYVNNAGDSIYIPDYNGYEDTIYSSVSYTLYDSSRPVDNLTLTGTADLTATDDYGYATLTGNAGNDTLVGGSGADTLIAGSGVDTLVTGTGSNTLVIDNAADVIEISAGAFNDKIESSISYTLGAGIDTLVLTGGSDLVGQGNDDATNSITGNAGDDTLIAGSGADTLVGGSGVDTLIAGTGNDVLDGRSASDTYLLNAGFGTTQINLSSGNGTIQFGAGISAADLSVSTVVDAEGDLALQISDGGSVVTLDDGLSGGLTEFGLPGDSQLNFQFGTGPELNFAQFLAAVQVENSTLAGASGNLILSGDAGSSLSGAIGDDTIIGSGAGDTIVAGSGNQALYGYGSGDVLAAGVGDDTVHGAGDDTLAAGSGNSILYGGSGTNTYLLAEGGTSTLYSSGGAAGPQVIFLPPGMTAADFTPTIAPDGDLVLQSVSGDTTAIIKGFFTSANSSSSAWILADQSGDSQLLHDWVATASSGTTGGNPSADSAYEAQVQALLEDYQANLSITLNQMGISGETVANPNDPSNANQYAFTGVDAQNVTVQGGVLNIGSSDSDQSNTVVTQEGTRTYTYSTPVYSYITIPGSVTFIPASDDSDFVNLGGDNTNPITVGGQSGYAYYNQPETVSEQTGTQVETETVPVYSAYTTETQGFTDYNITGDGGSDVITAAGPFVGTVVTGDGNDVDVDLGDDNSSLWAGHLTYYSPESLPPGAFIDVGNGVNDTISGTGTADVIAAGLGFDYITASLGSTIYVPMEGASTDVIGVGNAPYYGSGPFPKNTLVLPEGITPQDLQVRLVDNPGGNLGFETSIQLTYGDSTVLLDYDPGPPSWYLQGASSDDTDGINVVQFANGTVLTRTQLLAMAGAAIQVDDTYNPVVTQLADNVVANTPVSAADLFTASDESGSSIRVYQISNDPTSGAYFSLNGTVYSAGQMFDVAADQLSQLQYTPGAPGSSDTLTVSAFDGIVFGAATTISLAVPPPGSDSGLYQATGPDQTLTGSASGPDTLTGGYAGDTLVGASGEDTFVYNSGSGAETISETAPVNSSSTNVLQFGVGITPASISLTVAAGGELVATVGSSGDSVTIEGFNPTDPLNSIPIQQFQFADGTTLSLAQLLSQAQPSGAVGSVANADGTTTYYEVNMPGDPVYTAETESALGDLQDFTLNADGSSEADSFVYNVDGSVTQTEVATPAGGGAATTYVTDYNAQGQETSVSSTSPDGSMEQVTYDSQGRVATDDVTAANGSTQDATNSYNADGSYTETQVETPAGGGAASTFIIDYSAQSQELSSSTTYPDGSTEQVTYDSQGRPVTDDVASADGSAQDVTNSYNADGSYVQTTVTTPVGGAATTAVTDYDSNGNRLSENVYTPSSGGSYTDSWQNQDGSYGGYWWNASTQQYQETWQDSNGANWTDDYQYAAGGSPGSTGVSFTETYTDSAGDQGTRQYNAATGVTSLTWDSSATGMLTGTTTDSGFIGLQNNGELTNTQQDPSFFNPTVSPAFQSFLAGH
jgi:YD repeat-containing protein